MYVMTTRRLEIHSNTSDGTMSLRLEGELDIANNKTFAEEIATCVTEKPGHLRIDLCGLDYIDSTGLRQLLKANHEATAKGIRLTIHVLDGTLPHRVTHLTGLNDTLCIVVDDSQAARPLEPRL
jgi:anti-anti-sigma factor